MLGQPDPKIIYGFHILVVAPILFAIGTNRFPENYKQVLIYLAIFVALYHLYKLIMTFKQERKVEIVPLTEGMVNGLDCSKEEVHCIDMFDSNPGYSRPVINIKVGDIVIWKNIGELTHTVTSTATSGDQSGMSPDGLFNSGYMKPGQAFAVQFIAAGEYSYYCIPHKGWMRGKLIVQ